MVTTALDYLTRRNIWVSDEQILDCFEENYEWIDRYYYQILKSLALTAENTERIIRLFQMSKQDSTRVAIAECFENDTDGHIRKYVGRCLA